MGGTGAKTGFGGGLGGNMGEREKGKVWLPVKGTPGQFCLSNNDYVGRGQQNSAVINSCTVLEMLCETQSGNITYAKENGQSTQLFPC